MSRQLEDTVHDLGLPVNMIAFLERCQEILRENGTNSYRSLRGFEVNKFRRALWLVNQQVFGQTTVVDLNEEWREIVADWTNEKGVTTWARD